MLVGMGAEDIPDFWPMVVKWLRPTLARSPDNPTPEELLRQLVEKDAQLWIIVNGEQNATGAIVTRVEMDEAGVKRGVVVAIGGKGVTGKAQVYADTLRVWAEQLGCEYLCTKGRRGWLRLVNGSVAVGDLMVYPFLPEGVTYENLH